MKRNTWLIFAFSFLVFPLQECTDQDAGWPSYAITSLWISPIAREVRREVFIGSYQVFYEAGICYPATNLIQDMAAAMSDKGWIRLVYHPLNPGQILDHASDPKRQFGYFPHGKYYRVYTWSEYWEDAWGNIITYSFKYTVKAADDVRSTCTMECFGSFVPAKVWRSVLRIFREQPEGHKYYEEGAPL
jgi:hypothetical protein